MKLVRLMCGATGVDIGKGYGIFVSAQDNDIGIDRINTDSNADPPWEDTPRPSSEKVSVARITLYSIYRMENWDRP